MARETIAGSVQLHEATLALLRRVGVRVESPQALDLLASAGLRVDAGRRRVHPTSEQVQRALAQAPATLAVYGRRTEQPLVLGGAEVHVLSGGASIRVLDLDGHYEPATWEHLRQFNTLLDALPNVHMLLNQVDPQGDAAPGFYRRLAAEMLLGSPKPCCLQAGDAQDVAAMVEMGAVLRGSRSALAEWPVFMTGTNAEPPLCIPQHAAEIVVAASRLGVPCGMGDYVMMGITAPVTLAGALVQRNAVQLTALVLSQAAQPGARFYYVAASGSANMRTLDPVMANPQAVRLLRAAIGLGRSYGLPVVSLAATDAKAPDSQAACEMAVTLQTAMEAGAHLVQGPTSMMDEMMLSSLAQAVIDNDVAGYLLAARKPVSVSEATLALDAIADVVQGDGEGLKFAAHPHTAEHLRDDAWGPLVFAYETFASWQQAGAPSLLRRAESVAREILARHEPEPLPVEAALEIRHIAGQPPDI